jgi:hypothetical protein
MVAVIANDGRIVRAVIADHRPVVVRLVRPMIANDRRIVRLVRPMIANGRPVVVTMPVPRERSAGHSHSNAPNQPDNSSDPHASWMCSG